jgi:hypothetical protein
MLAALTLFIVVALAVRSSGIVFARGVMGREIESRQGVGW